VFDTDKNKLVEKIKNMPTFLHMLRYLQEEAARAESLRDYRSNKNRYQYDLLHDYRESIGGLIFFMNSGVYPFGWGNDDVAAYRVLFEELTRRGILKPEMLKILERGKN
jgi:hypothetical protein